MFLEGTMDFIIIIIIIIIIIRERNPVVKGDPNIIGNSTNKFDLS
jgi:hypothetical protein